MTEEKNREQHIQLNLPDLVEVCVSGMGYLVPARNQTSKTSSEVRRLDDQLTMIAIYALSGLIIAKFFEGLASELGKKFADVLTGKINAITKRSKPNEVNEVLLSVQEEMGSINLEYTEDTFSKVRDAKDNSLKRLKQSLLELDISPEEPEVIISNYKEILIFDVQSDASD